MHHFASFPESPKSTGNSQNPGDKSPRSPASELMPKLGTLCAAFLPWTEPATWLPFPWPFPWRLGDEKLEGPLAAPKLEKNGECWGNLSFTVVFTIWNKKINHPWLGMVNMTCCLYIVYTTDKNGDDLGMLNDIVLTTLQPLDFGNSLYPIFPPWIRMSWS